VLSRGFVKILLRFWSAGRDGVVLGRGFDSFEFLVSGERWCSAGSWVQLLVFELLVSEFGVV
jgi:hypothetical protein